MAISSLFNGGGALNNVVSALQYDSTTPGSEFFTVAAGTTLRLSDTSTKGLQFGTSGQNVNAIVAGTGASNLATTLATTAWVTAQIPGAGDATIMEVLSVADPSLLVGFAVRVSGTDVVAADRSAAASSQVSGILDTVTGTGPYNCFIQVDGERFVASDISALSRGDAVFLGDDGAIISQAAYDALAGTAYQTVCGSVTVDGAGAGLSKIQIQPRQFGQTQ